jgi:hypothetical protein
VDKSKAVVCEVRVICEREAEGTALKEKAVQDWVMEVK